MANGNGTIKQVVFWILGLVAIIISVSFGAWIRFVYAGLDAHSLTLSDHNGRISAIEQCVSRNYDMLTIINQKIDKLYDVQARRTPRNG